MTSQKKGRVLVVADTYYPKIDGTLIFIEQFLKYAQERFSLRLLVPYLGIKRGHHVTYVKPSRIVRLSGYQNMKISLPNLFRIKKAVRSSDLVFYQGPALLSILALLYAKRFRKRVVIYLHTIAWELYEKFLPPLINKIFYTTYKRFSITLYNRADEILVPYPDLKLALEEQGVHRPMSVAQLGVDIDTFCPAKDKAICKKKVGIDPRVRVIGYVGRLSKEKNIEVLIESFTRLREREEVMLLLVGDGALREKLEKVPGVRVTGFVRNVADYLRAMDVFVMPSLTETTSLATLEAMSCGVGVIASKVGYIKDYLVRDHNGLFFAKHSASMLTKKITLLLEDDQLRERLGRNARTMIESSFSWRKSINQISDLLEKHIAHIEKL